MTICKLCGKIKSGAKSCIEHNLIIDGKKYKPVPFFIKKQDVPKGCERCPDCGVLPGGIHHVGCSIEICPRCGERWVSCRCQGIKTKKIKNPYSAKIIQFKGR